MKIRTFKIGGVHPDENKLTHEVPTKVAALPKQAIFPLVALYADDDHWLTIASSVKRSVYL